MIKIRFFQTFATLFAFALPTLAAAQTFNVSPSQIFRASSRKGKFTCGYIQYKWLPGKLKTDGQTFIPISSDITSQNNKLKKAASSKKSAIQAKIDKLKLQSKSGAAACKMAGTGPLRTPTPIPGNFDSEGNVTAAGKANFGIPENLSGNTETGRQLSDVHTCTGCHEERTDRSYSNLVSAVPFEPMYIRTGICKSCGLFKPLQRVNQIIAAAPPYYRLSLLSSDFGFGFPCVGVVKAFCFSSSRTREGIISIMENRLSE